MHCVLSVTKEIHECMPVHGWWETVLEVMIVYLQQICSKQTTSFSSRTMDMHVVTVVLVVLRLHTTAGSEYLLLNT